MVTRIRTGNPAVDTALEPIWRVLGGPLLDGVFLEGSLSAGVAYRFTHGMRRPWTGWLLVDTTGGVLPYRVNVDATDKSSEIWLQASADTDIKIYLF